MQKKKKKNIEKKNIHRIFKKNSLPSTCYNIVLQEGEEWVGARMLCVFETL